MGPGRNPRRPVFSQRGSNIGHFFTRTMKSLMALLLTNKQITPLMTNGFFHPYHLDESTFNLRGFRGNFSFLFHFSMKIISANRIAHYGTPRFAASHLGLFCLPMSHKKDTRLICVNVMNAFVGFDLSWTKHQYCAHFFCERHQQL